MTSAYRIADEPSPGRLSNFIVTPLLPFVADVLGGSWIGLTWFVFNAHAMGSVNKKRETYLALISPLVSLIIAFLAGWAIQALHIAHTAADASLAHVLGMPNRTWSYVVVLIIAVKSAFAYEIQRSQEKSFLIYEYTGGRGRNAAALLAVAYVLRPFVLQWAFGVSDWLGWVVL